MNIRSSCFSLFLIGVVSSPCDFASAVDAPEAESTTAPRHSAKQVLSIAAAELRRGAENAARYKAKPPKYYADKRVWWVFFIQNAPPFIVDGDLLVVVDDLTSNACMEQANRDTIIANWG
jgi:hypothetical protein